MHFIGMWQNIKLESVKTSTRSGKKWNFTFMGADLDAMSVSQNMGFNKDSYLSFSKEKYAEVNNSYFDAAARDYAEKKSSGTSSKGFFSIFNKKDLR